MLSQLKEADTKSSQKKRLEHFDVQFIYLFNAHLKMMIDLLEWNLRIF